MARREVIIEVDAALERRLAKMPTKIGHAPRRAFTSGEDSAILKHWNRIGKRELAEALGISVETLRRRYRELTAG